MNLHKETCDFKAIRRQGSKVAELFHLEIANVPTGAVPFPDQADIACLLDPFARKGERGIPAPPACAANPHIARQQPSMV
ncbi:MAG: hypothetical protein ACJ8AI_01280 [Rhodopila sp.]